MGMLGNQIMEYDQLGVTPQRLSNRTQFSAPRNLYRSSDLKWVAISGTSQPIVERIFKAIGREDLIEAPQFRDNRTRLHNADELDAIISKWMINHTQQEAIDRFLECEATIAPVYNISDIDRKSTRLNSSHANISYAVFCLKKKTQHTHS